MTKNERLQALIGQYIKCRNAPFDARWEMNLQVAESRLSKFVMNYREGISLDEATKPKPARHGRETLRLMRDEDEALRLERKA